MAHINILSLSLSHSLRSFSILLPQFLILSVVFCVCVASLNTGQSQSIQNLTNRNVAFSLSCDSSVFIRLYCLFAPVQVAVILFHERETPTLFSHLFLNGNNLSVCSFFCCFAAGFLNGNISFSSFCLWFYTRKKIY